jgi:antitoxin (DNA-binding transcriptional repressor) of toxin-antitoxin stability system
MRSVNIAELKNRLSAYLQQVRAGEEADVSAEELVLVASGQLVLPSKKLNERAF